MCTEKCIGIQLQLLITILASSFGLFISTLSVFTSGTKPKVSAIGILVEPHEHLSSCCASSLRHRSKSVIMAARMSTCTIICTGLSRPAVQGSAVPKEGHWSIVKSSRALYLC